MLKNTKLILLAVSLLFLVSGAAGFCFRWSYTDIQADDDYKENTMVAVITDDMLGQWEEQIVERADDPESIIFAAEPVENRQFAYYTGFQKVKVTKVFQEGNSDITEGMECYVVKNSDCLTYYRDRLSVNGGFVNEMQCGQQYLLIMDAESVMPDSTRLPVFTTETVIFPHFCYTDSDTHNINPYIFDQKEDGATYVEYKGLEQNEFFTESEDGYESLMEMKHKLISRYPFM